MRSFTLLETVEIHKADENNVFLCHITSLSDELKEEIRFKLISVCRGLADAEKRLAAYSYQRTLLEFLRRYTTKTDDTKKGMIGELLSHILIRHLITHFSPISPFFNMEESSIKKAFDIVFRCSNSGEVWFTEVKSGHKAEQTARQKNNELLHLGKRSILAQMNGSELHIWTNAVNGAKLSIVKPNIRDEIERILSDCFVQAQDQEIDTQDFNVVLTSVLYADDTDPLLFDDVDGVRVNVEGDDLFKNLIVFSIQKETYEAVERFLLSEAA
ncbi:MAG: hypothetical protein ABJN11_10325 [Lentilitoribacter sp.]